VVPGKTNKFELAADEFLVTEGGGWADACPIRVVAIAEVGGEHVDRAVREEPLVGRECARELSFRRQIAAVRLAERARFRGKQAKRVRVVERFWMVGFTDATPLCDASGQVADTHFAGAEEVSGDLKAKRRPGVGARTGIRLAADRDEFTRRNGASFRTSWNAARFPAPKKRDPLRHRQHAPKRASRRRATPGRKRVLGDRRAIGGEFVAGAAGGERHKNQRQ
jgi:hypothetical protein